MSTWWQCLQLVMSHAATERWLFQEDVVQSKAVCELWSVPLLASPQSTLRGQKAERSFLQGCHHFFRFLIGLLDCRIQRMESIFQYPPGSPWQSTWFSRSLDLQPFHTWRTQDYHKMIPAAPGFLYLVACTACWLCAAAHAQGLRARNCSILEGLGVDLENKQGHMHGTFPRASSSSPIDSTCWSTFFY